MFRTWEFDIKRFLKTGKNTIEVRFYSTIPYIKKHQAEHPIPLRDPPHGMNGGNWVRKEQCNYGWDWGPCLLTCGICRPIKLIAGNIVRLKDIYISQKHNEDVSVTLDITAELTVTPDGKSLTASFIISHEKEKIAESKTTLKNGKAHATLTIQKPELWWLNDMGKQPLYTVTVNLLDKDGATLDTMAKAHWSTHPPHPAKKG